jgi:hypothetical protein
MIPRTKTGKTPKPKLPSFPFPSILTPPCTFPSQTNTDSFQTFKADAYKGEHNLEERIKRIRDENFSIKNSNKGYFISESKASFKQDSHNTPAGLNIELLKDLKKSHFKLGVDKEAMRTTNEREFKRITADVSNAMGLRKFNIENDRQRHFQLGDSTNNKGIYKTENKQRFKWVQPVLQKHPF